jgi:UDP:flavonoid glycosyltransferase YjiC (YdhE family)
MTVMDRRSGSSSSNDDVERAGAQWFARPGRIMMLREERMRIAYFVTPHGFGHAARAAAVMVALQEIDPAIQLDIFTQVPRWFFQDSLVQGVRYYAVGTDVGLVQTTSLHEDLPATVRRLDSFFPCDRALVTTLAALLRSAACALVLCDIAPLGLVAARAARVPSVLIENFTWDWIYQGYEQEEAGLARHIPYLRSVFATADYHVQMEPVCCPYPADLTACPVSRPPQRTRQQTRAQLGIPAQAPAVLLTMGGIPESYAFLPLLHQHHNTCFVVLGAGDCVEQHDNVIVLPYRSTVFPPDLVYACDAVVSKAGYSIVAEVYHAGVPFGHVRRERFREGPVLDAYIADHMQALTMTEPEFHSGAWLSCLPDLLALPRQPHRETRGAEQIARFVYELVRSQYGP